MDIKGWLKEQMVSAEAYDAEELLSNFLSEMQKGLCGEKSSLAMIPAYVNTEGEVQTGKTVAVIDAGGTNLRIGLARVDEQGNIQLYHFTKQPMPGRDRELTPEQFYKVLVDALEPINEQFEVIGFCFSYAAEIQPNYDGRLLYWTKEIKIPGMVGTLVGAGLLETLAARGITGKKVVLLNDTVASLLAGVTEGRKFSASSYIGFILGTGTNSAYIEKNVNIIKVKGLDPNGSQAINVESGAFAAFRRGPFDLELDAASEVPGGHVFEKTISGAYIGPLTLKLLKALAEKGVFSQKGAEVLRSMEELSTIHIDNFTSGNGRDTGMLESGLFTNDDHRIMKTVFSAVVERAALLTAVNIAAAVIKSGAGTDSAHPVCVNIDGSTYYKTSRLANLVQGHLAGLLDTRGLHVRCIHVDDAPVTGAAIAGLTTF